MMALIGSIFFAGLAVLALVYYLMLGFWIGFGINFGVIWPAMSVVCAGLSYLCHLARKGLLHISAAVWVPITVVVGIGLVVFLILEMLVITTAFKAPEPKAKYCIILGCKVEGERPSLSLRYRIDAAAEYLKENPDTIAIASGGQGEGELISEAQCIRDELVERGIAPERIVMENQSTSTTENIEFSKAYIEDVTDSVVVITSEYHVFRGVQIAKKAGLENVSGLRADPGPVMALHYYVREAFAIVKDFVVGNM
ncbi:MAG: YdcF family protein [Firmicutes bacterium]|nr:YdcF family protein [Bacillota bacterium]